MGSSSIGEKYKCILQFPEKCYCEHAYGWTPENGIMCGREGDVTRVAYCAHWETCTGPTEWSSGVEQSNKAQLCEAKCGCATANGQTPNNGFKGGLNGNSALTGEYCASMETCTGTTTESDGVDYKERATLCT